MTTKKLDGAAASRRRYLIGPICFVHVFTFGIYNSTIVLFFPEYVGKFLYPNTTSETSADSSICNSDSNSTDTESEKVIQAEVARFTIYASLCVGIPCIISNLLLGSISDRYGRKMMLMIPTIGLLLVEMSTAILMYLDVHLYYLLIPMVVQGFVGDTFSLILFVMSYVSDITENNRSRTFGIAIMECCIGMGVVIGGIVSGYMIEAFGYIWPVVTSPLCKIINIFLIACLPATDVQNKSTDPLTLKTVLDFIKQSLEFYYSKKYRGLRWKYNICIVVYVMGCVCLIGRNAAEVLYIISPPFCLSPVLVGWFHAAQQTVQQGISMILIRVFLIFMNAEAVSTMGALSGIAGFIVQGLATSNTVLFLCKIPFSILYLVNISFDMNHEF